MPSIVLSGSVHSDTQSAEFSFSRGVGAGEFLAIILGDGYGYGGTLQSVTDSAGNDYAIGRVGGNVDGDGDIAIAYCHVQHTIAPGDTLTLDFPNWWYSFAIVGVSFPSADGFVGAEVEVGTYQAGSLTLSAVPGAGDLVLAVATAENDLSPDPGNGWIDIVNPGDPASDPPENCLCVAYQSGSGHAVTYDPVVTSATGYSAAVLITFTNHPPPPGPPTITSPNDSDVVTAGDFTVTVQADPGDFVRLFTQGATRGIAAGIADGGGVARLQVVPSTYGSLSLYAVASNAYGTSEPSGVVKVYVIARVSELGYVPVPFGNYVSPWQNYVFGGFYVHRNQVFLEGAASSSQSVSNPVDRVIVDNIPEALQPAEPTRVSIPVWTMNPATPGVDPLPTSVMATIDGSTITLDELPPYINSIPLEGETFSGVNGTPEPIFTEPIQYVFVFGGSVSWPLGPIPAEGALDWRDLTPYLGDAFENVDGEIAIDNTTIVLRGRVRAKVNIANSSWAGQAEPYGPQSNYPLLVNLPPELVGAATNGVAVVVRAEGFEAVGIFKSDGNTQADPSAGTPGLKLYVADDVLYVGEVSSGYGSGSDPSAQVTLPMRDDTLPMSELFAPDVKFGGNNGWAPAVEATPFSGGGVDNPVTEWSVFSPGNNDPVGCSNIAGLDTHTADGPVSYPIPGQRRLQDYANTNSWYYASNNVSVPANSHGSVEVTNSLDAYLNIFRTQPDWVALIIAVFGSASGGLAAVSVEEVHLINASGSSYELVDNQGNLLDGNSGPNPPSQIGEATNGPQGPLIGWVAQPGLVPDYGGDPHNPAGALLWRPSALPTEWIAKADWSSGTPLFLSQGAGVGMNFFLIPFWEQQRKNWILKGDVLTLDGAGWPAISLPHVPPLAPGILKPGAGASGQLPHLPVHGAALGGAQLKPAGSSLHVAQDRTSGKGGAFGHVQWPERHHPGVG